MQLGLDQTSFQQDHEYLTVIIDHDAKVVTHVADWRKRGCPDSFYREHGLSERQPRGEDRTLVSNQRNRDDVVGLLAKRMGMEGPRTTGDSLKAGADSGRS